MKKLMNKKAFTIMEMLIVVAIIAVLVAIAITTFNGALTKAKEATDVANIRAAYAETQVAILTENLAEANYKTTFEAALPDGKADGLNYSTKYNWKDKTAGSGTEGQTGYVAPVKNYTITYKPSKLNNGKAYTWTLESADVQ